MFDVMHNDWNLAERELRLNAPEVRFRQEWEAHQRVDRLESELRGARARLERPEAAA